LSLSSDENWPFGEMKATGQNLFPVMLIRAVITLAHVNVAPNESYWVTVLFDTVFQIKFGNIKFKLSSLWSEITLEKLMRMAPLKMRPKQSCRVRKIFLSFHSVRNKFPLVWQLQKLMIKIRKNLAHFSSHDLRSN